VQVLVSEAEEARAFLDADDAEAGDARADGPVAE
jgi:hypothetical protein